MPSATRARGTTCDASARGSIAATIAGLPGITAMPCATIRPRLSSARAVKSCSPADEPAMTQTTSASRSASAMRERIASRLSPTGARRSGSPPHSRTKAAIMRELNSTIRPGRRASPGSMSSSPVGRIATTGRGRTATSTTPAASSAPTSYGRIWCPRGSSGSLAATSSPTRRTCCHGDAAARTCTRRAALPASARAPAGSAGARVAAGRRGRVVGGAAIVGGGRRYARVGRRSPPAARRRRRRRDPRARARPSPPRPPTPAARCRSRRTRTAARRSPASRARGGPDAWRSPPRCPRRAPRCRPSRRRGSAAPTRRATHALGGHAPERVCDRQPARASRAARRSASSAARASSSGVSDRCRRCATAILARSAQTRVLEAGHLAPHAWRAGRGRSRR